MNKQYKKYIGILIATQMFTCLVVALIFIFLSNEIHSRNVENLHIIAMDNAEESMTKSVDYVIDQISERSLHTEAEVSSFFDFILEYLALTDERTMDKSVLSLMNRIDTLEYGSAIQLALCNSVNNRMLLYKGGEMSHVLTQYSIDDINELLKPAVIQRSFSKGNYLIYMFAEQEDLDTIVKEFIYDKFYSSTYEDENYIWVNQILNLKGGDDYAMRLIYPYNKEKEGEYLSTKTKDNKGQYYNKKQINQIRQYGESLNTYYVDNDGKEVEMISYSKLYAPFNWVIATSRSNNEVLTFADGMKEDTLSDMRVTMIICLIVMVIIFFVSIVVVLNAQVKYRKNVDIYVKTETEYDNLTGAYSRKSGEVILEEYYNQSKYCMTTPLLMMVDIDNFKVVNDTFGHDMGDVVLKKMSKAIMSNIREANQLIRWGGEEFVILFNNVNTLNQYQIGKRVLKCVSSQVFEYKNEKFSVTVSIGGSYFDNEDKEYAQALKRADVALYNSKKTGKNKYTSYDDIK